MKAEDPNLGSGFKDFLFSQRAARSAWGVLKKEQLHREFWTRREFYAAQAEKRNLKYDPSEVTARTRARLASRGVNPIGKPLGEIHTFAFVPRISWHPTLFPDLAELGPVSEFDYSALGFRYAEFLSGNFKRRQEMNALALNAMRKAHRRRPIDWIFAYATGVDLLASTVRQISSELGVPVVNMCLDDKQSWETPRIGDQRGGQIDIASAFDLSWTSSSLACEWYLVEGGNPVYMPEGFDQASYRPLDVPKDIEVSFVGGAYGFRPRVIETLRRNRINVQVFGAGWGGPPLAQERFLEILNRSRINLGMGGIGWSDELTNVKGRDFEIPASGGGVYLTSFNSDLAKHYVIGEEILCYRTIEEAVELIRWYAIRPDSALEMASKARARCLREHRWIHRYLRVCEILGVIERNTP